MSTLIKAASVRYEHERPQMDDVPGALATERANDAVSVRCAPSMERMRTDQYELELESLRNDIAQLQQAAAKHEEDLQRRVTAAYDSGFAEGEVAGRERTTAETNARDAALRSGIDTAVEQFSTQLQALERLCASIALAALQRIVGDASARATLVGETVRHHLAQLATTSVLEVDVSREDFEADIDASRLLGPNADKEIVVKASSTLKGGECRIKLNLGALDASLDLQFARIQTALLEACA